MKQMFQSARTGHSTVLEVPAPAPVPGNVLVANSASLVSAGTERMVLEFAEKNMLQKAQARPDLVRQVLDKAKREGVLTTLEAVRNRLQEPLSLGYSSAGTVVAVGDGISDIKVGHRVACSGMKYASHAEVVSVPRLLTTPIPSDEVSFEEAAFTTVGAIALHGIRITDVKLGETVAVIGLGLVGQLTVQMLKANGCVVLGMDLNDARCQLAAEFGCDATASSAAELKALVAARTHGAGVDSVLITAATDSSEPLELAGDIARSRASVTAVGAVGMTVPRRTFYEKELDFRISRSYGPGRYDPEYEEKGHDYPISYVRWTESRNMQAFLELVASGKLRLKPLITHRFTIERAVEAYDLITGKSGPQQFLAVLITYPETPRLARRLDLPRTQRQAAPDATLRVGMLGAGLFASSVLLPAMQKVPRVSFSGVCTASGSTARHIGDRFKFDFCTTSEEELLADAKINTIAISTRHHLHARQVVAALGAGKHVFCEKPLCLSEQELAEIVRAYHYAPSSPLLMVGYNRRFSTLAQMMRAAFKNACGPITAHYRVNAGFVPPTHWVHDPAQGGGRIIGEVCHFVDFLMFITGSLPVSVFANSLPTSGEPMPDDVAVSIQFANGSVGTIQYASGGDKSFGKERVEAIGAGTVAVLDDFRSLEVVHNGHRNLTKLRLRQDKGHVAEWEALTVAVRDGQAAPISPVELIASTLATFAINHSLAQSAPIRVDAECFLAAALLAE